MKMTNQQKRLLEHLNEFGPITPLDAWLVLGIQRLSARVFELKQMGYEINTRLVKRTNRFNEVCQVAEYYIPDAQRTLPL